MLPEKYAGSSLTDEKSLELFRALERAMREEKKFTKTTVLQRIK